VRKEKEEEEEEEEEKEGEKEGEGEGEEKEKEKHQWVQAESAAERKGFSFSGPFKTYTTPWEGWPRRLPPNNE
jgi:hypothetical protein